MMSENQRRMVTDAISGYCTACPPALMSAEIDRAADDFIEATGGIPSVVGPVPFCREDGIYRVVAPFGGSVVSVDEAIVDGRHVDRNVYRVSYMMGGMSVVSFGVGMARTGGLLSFRISWKPTGRTKMLPVEWFMDSMGAISNGAVAAICAQLGNPWGNQMLAQRFAGDYANNVSDAIIRKKSSGENAGNVSCFDADATWCPCL